MIDLSIVIPAYNEEKRIGETIKKILAYLDKKGFSFEIIVVTDGCKDNTTKVVKNIKNDNVRVVDYEINRGKGFYTTLCY